MPELPTPSHPRIVVLDGHTLNPGDLSWSDIEALGPTKIYPRTSPEDVRSRAEGAEILLVNKVVLDQKTLQGLSGLRYVGITATGINNVDLQAARALGIVVTNAVGYSTASVAQHVFALLLELCSGPGRHNSSVKAGDWSNGEDFSYTVGAVRELQGMNIGLYGFGHIGQATARLALAFGMNVHVHTRTPDPEGWPEIAFVELEALFSQSMVVSLHTSLRDDNMGIVNRRLLNLMPEGAYLINTARGGLINEADLAEAIRTGRLAGAGLDVLSSEPPPADHPLLALPNAIITPHMAWASREARRRLMAQVVENLEAWLAGKPVRVVNN